MKKLAVVLGVIFLVALFSGWVYAGEIHSAVLSGKIEKVKACLEKKPDGLNEKGSIYGLYDWTPLHVAADRGNIGIAELLIKKGASVNERNSDGQTPLHLAAKSGNLEVAKLLIQWGAELIVKDNCNKTPFDWADTQEMKDLLMQYGAHQGQ